MLRMRRIIPARTKRKPRQTQQNFQPKNPCNRIVEVSVRFEKKGKENCIAILQNIVPHPSPTPPLVLFLLSSAHQIFFHFYFTMVVIKYYGLQNEGWRGIHVSARSSLMPITGRAAREFCSFESHYKVTLIDKERLVTGKPTGCAPLAMFVDSRCAHGKRLGAFRKHKKLEHTMIKKRQTSVGLGELSTFTFTPRALCVDSIWVAPPGPAGPEERFDRKI
jgi:hypothetical protein